MSFSATTINYAGEYAAALDQAYEQATYFGKLWAAKKPDVTFNENHTVDIPTLSVKGRANGNRDTIGNMSRNYNVAKQTKTLSHHRYWDTLVHPRDIDETKGAASITNITKTMNEEQKFPELDALMVSSLFTLRNAKSAITAKTKDYLTSSNVLVEFDGLMKAMDQEGVPAQGRILYVDVTTNYLLKNAVSINRYSKDTEINRLIARLDEVEIQWVPDVRMKSAFTFSETDGFTAASGAKNVRMCLVHPSAVIPCITYDFAALQSPSAVTQGKYYYYEESFEDVFIFDKKYNAIQFLVESAS